MSSSWRKRKCFGPTCSSFCSSRPSSLSLDTLCTRYGRIIVWIRGRMLIRFINRPDVHWCTCPVLLFSVATCYVTMCKLKYQLTTLNTWAEWVCVCVCLYIQGNFFQNIGSITLFAVIGTAFSAFIVGGGIYFLGQVRIDVFSISSGSNLSSSRCLCL